MRDFRSTVLETVENVVNVYVCKKVFDVIFVKIERLLRIVLSRFDLFKKDLNVILARVLG